MTHDNGGSDGIGGLRGDLSRQFARIRHDMGERFLCHPSHRVIRLDERDAMDLAEYIEQCETRLDAMPSDHPDRANLVEIIANARQMLADFKRANRPPLRAVSTERDKNA